MRRLVFAVLALATVAFPVAASTPRANKALHPVTVTANPPSVSAASPVRAPLRSQDPSLVLSLMGFALVGATSQSKGSFRRLSKSYIFGGTTYGPTEQADWEQGTWVPEDFPDLDDDGEVIHPEGTAAAARQARARGAKPNASPPNTGGVNTGESGGGSTTTVSGQSADELETMDKPSLVELAESHNITVERLDDNGDAEDGEPLKRDYVRALSATK